MGKIRWCPNCHRNVHLVAPSNYGFGCLIAIGLVILGLIVPLWPISMPVFFGLAIIVVFLSGVSHYRCPICQTPKRMTERRRVPRVR